MRKYFIFLSIIYSTQLFGQTSDILVKANQLGTDWKFEEAIVLLENGIKTNPKDAELYYWLGRYSHYLVYDTRPFENAGDKWSKEKVLNNLKKAVELNPDYGDAKYFLAAEYGARAHQAIKTGDTIAYKNELLEAKKFGGFPFHVAEQGRNILKSCDPNAILVVDGDAHYNILQYLQAIEGFRRDISLICLSLLERPYYVKLVRDGAGMIIKPVPLICTDNMIMEMHNYKWRENEISIKISDKARQLNNYNDSIADFKWQVKPDEGENRLWTGTAMLIGIFETNRWERPIHYAYFGLTDLSGLEDNYQIVGLTARFLPYKVKGTRIEYDKERFESIMLNPENYKDYSDISKNQQPRVSGLFGNLNRYRLVEYANFCIKEGDRDKAELVLKKMNEFMPISIFPLDTKLKADIENLEIKLKIKE
jgi:tetratricopeptide (TPR) repeat protein